MGILAAMTFVRFGLEPLVKVLRHIFRAQGSWEKSSEYYILREVRSAAHGPFGMRHQAVSEGEMPFHAQCLIAAWLQVYRPLEFLFSVAAFTTLAENFLPQLISLPKVYNPCTAQDMHHTAVTFVSKIQHCQLCPAAICFSIAPCQCNRCC